MIRGKEIFISLFLLIIVFNLEFKLKLIESLWGKVLYFKKYINIIIIIKISCKRKYNFDGYFLLLYIVNYIF